MTPSERTPPTPTPSRNWTPTPPPASSATCNTPPTTTGPARRHTTRLTPHPPTSPDSSTARRPGPSPGEPEAPTHPWWKSVASGATVPRSESRAFGILAVAEPHVCRDRLVVGRLGRVVPHGVCVRLDLEFRRWRRTV